MKIVFRHSTDRREVPSTYECIVRFVDPDLYAYLDPSGTQSLSRDEFICSQKDNYHEETARCRVLKNSVLTDSEGNVLDISENLGILERVGVKIIVDRKETPKGRDFDEILNQIPNEWMKEPFILEFTMSVPIRRDLPYHLSRVAIFWVPESPRKRRRIEPEEDMDECIICFSNMPDTLVVPCMHRVVCRECTKKLMHTPDRDVCVRCRQPIEAVYQDELE